MISSVSGNPESLGSFSHYARWDTNYSKCLVIVLVIVNIVVDVRLLGVHLELNIKKFALDMNKLLGKGISGKKTGKIKPLVSSILCG